MQVSLKRVMGAAAILGGFALTACQGPTMAPLVSAQFPPSANSAKSEPQPLNSLPVGAANLGTAPGATHPQYLAWTFKAI